MNPRPASVTFVCRAMIILSTLSAAALVASAYLRGVRTKMALNAVSIPMQFTLSAVWIAVILLSATFMLRRAAWGRQLYIIGGALSMVSGLFISHRKTMMIPDIVLYAVFVFLLTRRKASAYFTQSGVLA